VEEAAGYISRLKKIVRSRAEIKTLPLITSLKLRPEHRPAFCQTLKRQFDTPVDPFFMQIADRHVDGSAEVNCEICVSFGSPVAYLN
jgi:hypothetical protein